MSRDDFIRWTTWTKFIGLKIWNESLIFSLHEACIIKRSKGVWLFFSVLYCLDILPDRMGAIQPRHHLWRWGGWRVQKETIIFLRYGGSCSSKIVLTVCLTFWTQTPRAHSTWLQGITNLYRLYLFISCLYWNEKIQRFNEYKYTE